MRFTTRSAHWAGLSKRDKKDRIDSMDSLSTFPDIRVVQEGVRSVISVIFGHRVLYCPPALPIAIRCSKAPVR